MQKLGQKSWKIVEKWVNSENGYKIVDDYRNLGRKLEKIRTNCIKINQKSRSNTWKVDENWSKVVSNHWKLSKNLTKMVEKRRNIIEHLEKIV